MNRDVLQRICAARPTLESSPLGPRELAELDRIIGSSRRRSAKRRPSTLGIAGGLAAVVVAVGATTIALDAPASATSDVRHAVERTASAGSGEATMSVESVLDGAQSTGTIRLRWSGRDESYEFDYPPPIRRFETRVVSGAAYQRVAEGAWMQFRADDPPGGGPLASGGLATISGGFALIAAHLEFEQLESGAVDRYRAIGDLTTLDAASSGFVFGTNGAPGLRTTALELWTDRAGRVSRIRTEFEGTSGGKALSAIATTDVDEIGRGSRIEAPLG